MADVLTVLKQHGNKIPQITYEEAKRAGLELAVAAAVLDQETGGGENIFGHDPTIYAGAGMVTKAKYLAYRAERNRTGQMQGVGPMQLTWSGYQNLADAMGGCWDPRCNCRVGFRTIASHIRQSGLHNGLRAYNGSGPAAENYARTVEGRVHQWRSRLAGATPPKPPPPPKPVPPPKPLPPPNYPKQAQFWDWLRWRTGTGKYKGHAGDPKMRPHLPKSVPAAWGRFLRIFNRRRKK